MTTTYTPRPDSLPSKVIAFFVANQDEQLTIDDVADKFSAVRNSVHTNLRLAVEAGQLKRSKNDEGEYVYALGKASGINIDQVHFGASAKPAPPAAKRGYTAARHEVFDFDALVVEEGVPFHSNMKTRGQDKWGPLFAKLKKPKQSLCIPASARGAVGAAATKRNRLKTQGTFRVALVSDTTARVWRVA